MVTDVADRASPHVALLAQDPFRAFQSYQVAELS